MNATTFYIVLWAITQIVMTRFLAVEIDMAGTAGTPAGTPQDAQDAQDDEIPMESWWH